MTEINATKINRSKRTRPRILKGKTYKIKTGCGNLYVTINEDENGNVLESFCQLGHSGGCRAVSSEATGRLISYILRIGGDPREIIDQLKELKCPKPIWHEGKQVFSCYDGIAKALERHLEEGSKNGQ